MDRWEDGNPGRWTFPSTILGLDVCDDGCVWWEKQGMRDVGCGMLFDMILSETSSSSYLTELP